MAVAEFISVAPVATVVIMGIALVMSLVIQTTNRIITSRMIGWDNYRAMQKEMSEFRKESMAAARSNDPKQLEKIKKKQPQMNAMQAKMMKPQMIQMMLSICYFPIWILLKPIFEASPIAYIPSFGVLPFWIWYMIASFFLGTVITRVLGSMPIE